MFRGLRAPQWFVQREIRALIRSFPSERVKVIREVDPAVSELDLTYGEHVVFEGEGLFAPSVGDVARYGLGQVEEDQSVVIVPGNPDIRQGDFLDRQRRIAGGAWTASRRYQVMDAQNHWKAFALVKVRQFSQVES